MKTLDELLECRQVHIDKEGGPRFMGLPERWLDTPHFRCQNGHVSRRVLRSELKGDCCLKCGTNCLLTFPEDCDDSESEDGCS